MAKWIVRVDNDTTVTVEADYAEFFGDSFALFSDVNTGEDVILRDLVAKFVCYDYFYRESE